MDEPTAAAPAPPASHAPMDASISVEDAVRAIVAEALGRTLDQVPSTANLMDDLGAESLDFLDIVFRIEREFGIQITRGEMEGAARGDMTDEEFAPAGLISDAGLARLRELLPESAARIQPGLRPREILGLFTVQTFANLVHGKRAGQSA
jgi:acyl carrier protein